MKKIPKIIQADPKTGLKFEFECTETKDGLICSCKCLDCVSKPDESVNGKQR